MADDLADDPRNRIMEARVAARIAAIQEGAQEAAALRQPPSDDEESRLLSEEADLLFNEDRRLETVRKLKEEKEEAERRQRSPRSD